MAAERGMPEHMVALLNDMKAIAYSRRGDSSVLSAVERELPQAGPGEVRVKIVVSGVNPTDWKSRASVAREMEFPEIVPNQDGAGVVDSVGEGVASPAVGDRVWVYLAQHEGPGGTAQEYTVVPAERAVVLPEGVDFEVGASLGVPAMTAHRALTVHENGPARLAPGSLAGRTVLVAGGAGAVGHAAIQLAVWAGAEVATTVSSPEKERLARAAGTQHVIDYRTQDVVAELAKIAPSGVDHIVEVSMSANAELDVAVIANHGSVGYYADDGGNSFQAPVRESFAKNVRWQGLLMYTVGERALANAADDITAALADGALPVGESAGLPLTWFPLEETARAHDAVEGGVVGKVLIRVAEA